MASMAAETELSEEVWSPEQQIQELLKRTGVYDSTLVERLSFKPNPDDVIVAVPPKNGTTWLLHLCHQIRMQGQEPNFEDQNDVIGMLELLEVSKKTGRRLTTLDQPSKPRIFATHRPYDFVPKGGRIIYCFRDQSDAALSYYYFLDTLFSLRGRVSLLIFAQHYVLEKIEFHLKDLLVWWEHRHDNGLLVLFFDDLKEDHEGGVHRIAKFMGVECNDDIIARVVHTTTHAEMARHQSKFGVRRFATFIADKLGENPPPEGESVSRVRKDGGKSGEGKQRLPVEIQQRINQMWQDIVTAKLGFKDLKEMRESWQKEQNES